MGSVRESLGSERCRGVRDRAPTASRPRRSAITSAARPDSGVGRAQAPTRHCRFRLCWPALFLPPLLPLRERAVDYTPTSITHAPAPSSTDTGPSIERHVGALVATAGIAIAEALDEHRHGALSPRTKMRGGDLICELVRLRQFLIADLPDFDSIARVRGVAMLRAADVSPATANVLVDEVLDLVAKLTRAALN
jgi:hypothetical protein